MQLKLCLNIYHYDGCILFSLKLNTLIAGSNPARENGSKCLLLIPRSVSSSYSRILLMCLADLFLWLRVSPLSQTGMLVWFGLRWSRSTHLSLRYQRIQVSKLSSNSKESNLGSDMNPHYHKTTRFNSWFCRVTAYMVTTLIMVKQELPSHAKKSHWGVTQ